MARKPAYEELEQRTRDLETETLERKKAEEALMKHMHNLGERVKELNCLYSISKLIEQGNISLEEIVQGIVNLIPPSLRYPQITCARIILEDQEFRTGNFKETPWKQASDITMNNERIGTLEVYCLEEKLGRDEDSYK